MRRASKIERIESEVDCRFLALSGFLLEVGPNISPVELIKGDGIGTAFWLGGSIGWVSGTEVCIFGRGVVCFVVLFFSFALILLFMSSVPSSMLE
jgi:hypothetical protein